MLVRVRSRDRFRSRPLFALILGAWALAGSPVLGFNDPPTYPVQPKPKPKGVKGLLSHREPTCGTLGYGPPGPQPGFQGFGLRFGLNYGYGGGNALGVGNDGGFPLFGGPGYPHPWPKLRRLGGITAFPFDGGPGCPSPAHPNYFGEPGPLVFDRPVVRYEDDDSGSAGETEFGRFSGMLPYPEKVFAPFSSEGDNSLRDSVQDSIIDSQAPPPPPPPPPSDPPARTGEAAGRADAGNPIGIDTEPVVEDSTTRGLKVTKVYPGQLAAQSGLSTGDVIRSANGFFTEQPGNLEWIIANAAPDKTLKLTVRTARDGEVRVVATRLR